MENPVNENTLTQWLGYRLCILCREHHTNFSQLSQATGIGLTTLKRMKNGVGNPCILTVKKICDALHITLAQFFTEEENAHYIDLPGK